MAGYSSATTAPQQIKTCDHIFGQAAMMVNPSGVGRGNKAVLTWAHAADVHAHIAPIMNDVWSLISFGLARKNKEAVDHELSDDNNDDGHISEAAVTITSIPSKTNAIRRASSFGILFLTGVRSMLIRSSLLLLIAAALAAQPATPPKPAVIDGKVVNSVTNEPLRKVELALSNTIEGEDEMRAAMAMFGTADSPSSPPPPPKIEKKSYKATTDANGKFHFPAVDPGDYYLKATHPAFVDEEYKPASSQSVEGKLHISAADELAGLTLRMTPRGAISGHVLDEDGDPVANAMVEAMTYRYTGGHRKLSPADSSTTNDRGEYRLGKLPPGRYYVSANSIKMDFLGGATPPPKDGAPETGYVTTYYPHTIDGSLASRLDVAAGADITGISIQLQKSKVVRIKGQAVTTEGTPIKGGQVMLMASGNVGSMQMGTLSAEGKFELANVQPGSYMMMTIQMGGSKPSITMQPIVVPDEGLPNLKLGAQVEKPVQGKIVVEGNSKVELKGLAIMLAGEDDSPAMPALATVTETGAFNLKVSSMPYRLEFEGLPPGAYLKSVTLNGRECLGQALDFTNGSGDIVITLGTDGGKVDAAVKLADKSLYDATVVLLPSDPARRVSEAVRNGSTDETGHASFKDVPPGEYMVFAWEKIDADEWLDPDVIKAVEKQGTRLTVGPNSSGKVELKAIPRA